MSTTFKVGDRVKHRLGDAVIVPKGERFAHIPDGYVCFRVIGYDYGADDNHHSGAPSELTLVEPAPPPDTRKRLRDITDLADGDVVVIAGVELTARTSTTSNGLAVWRGGYGYAVERGNVADMLLDEVRRKPKTKKRRVYEEAAPSEARVGDLITQNVLMGAAKRWSGDREELEGCSVWRLVEETEVPR